MKVKSSLILSILSVLTAISLAGSVISKGSELSCSGKELPTCEHLEVARKEYHRKVGEDYQKLRTICECNCSIGYLKALNHYIPEIKSEEYLKNVLCVVSILYHPEIILNICNTGELCRTDNYTDYGIETGDLKYVDQVIPRCLCDRFRECVAKNQTPNAENEVNYYCELKELVDYAKLPPCKGNDTYKVEYYRDYKASSDGVKMDTEFRCKCEFELKISEFQNYFTSIYFNTTEKKYKCSEKPKKRITDCREHNVALKSFRYLYGEERNDTKYEETVEKFCKCPGYMQLTTPSIIPNDEHHSLRTFRYDEVQTQRCMRPIPKELIACTKQKVYKVEINLVRYDKNTGCSLPEKRVNTYIYCICEYLEKISHREVTRTPDDSISNQEILREKCQMKNKPRSNESCVDYAICQEDNMENTGLEEPGKMHVDFITTFCKCDKGRSCEKVGQLENRGIHRCIKKSFQELKMTGMPICKEFQAFQFIINETVSSGDSFKNVTQNSFQECRCFSRAVLWKSEKDGTSPKQIIHVYVCAKIKGQRVKLSYCKKEEECDKHNLQEAGLERPSAKIFTNSVRLCDCNPPRIAAVTKLPNADTSESYLRCMLPNVTNVKEVKLDLCNPGQMFKKVIYYAIGGILEGQHNTEKKMNTILFCLCEEVQYNRVNSLKINLDPDPTNRTLWIKSYFCPTYPYVKEDFPPCVDFAVCSKEVYTEYGSDIGAGIKYLWKKFTFCDCNGTRICNVTGTDHPELVEGEESTVNTYRCIPEELIGASRFPCNPMINDVFLVRVFHKLNTSSSEPNEPDEVQMNSFPRCLCYGGTNESFGFVSYIDPLNPSERFESHICLKRSGTPDKIFCTEEDQVCVEDLYEEYGRERPGTFLYGTEKKCICSINKLCTSVEFHDDATLYRCLPIENRFENFTKVDQQLPRCKADEVYEMTYYYGYDHLNTILKCTCPGEGFRPEPVFEEDEEELNKPSNSTILVTYTKCVKIPDFIDHPGRKGNCWPGDACRSETAKLYGYAYEEFYLDYIKINCHCVMENIFNLTCSELDLPWVPKKAPRIIESQCQNAKCHIKDTCGAAVFDSKKKLKRNELYCHCVGELLCIETSKCEKIGEEAYRYQECAKKRANVPDSGNCPGVSHRLPFGGG